MIARAVASAGIPATKEPQGLSLSDGKRPDGLTLIPWQAGRAMEWDVTVCCPLAESYVEVAALEAGEAAEIAAARSPQSTPSWRIVIFFQPIAVESLGPINDSAVSFLGVLGRRIADISGEVREVSCFIPAVVRADSTFQRDFTPRQLHR